MITSPEAIGSVYLFSGEEELMKWEWLQRLRATLLPDGLEEMNETRLPPSADATQIIAACETLPFMADKRLVVIEDSAFFAAKGREEETERLCAYVAEPPSTVCLVFYCRGQVDTRRKLTQRIAKRDGIVAFDYLSEPDIARWANKRLSAAGQSIRQDALDELVLRSGRALAALKGELEKLTAYAHGRDVITRKDVEEMVAPSLESSIFTMMDHIIEGRAQAAYQGLYKLVQSGESRIGILAMLNRAYRNLLHTRALLEEGSSAPEIEKKLGISGYVSKRLIRQVRLLDVPFLRGALALCVDTDYAIKSGQMREDVALERAISALCARKLPAQTGNATI